MSVIQVKFGNSAFNEKTYSYNCKYDVEVGEKVVVESPHDGYVLVTVVSLSSNMTTPAAKNVVCKIDDTEYKEDKVKEEKRKAITKQLESKVEKFNKIKMFEMLVSSDPEAAALLAQLKTLN